MKNNKYAKKIMIIILSLFLVLGAIPMIASQILLKHPLATHTLVGGYILYSFAMNDAEKEMIEKATKIEQEARKENTIAARKWVRETYGATVSEVIELKYHGRSNGWGSDSVYRLESPFALGTVFVDSETQEVEGGFSLEGTKFQHLYSEWVKKQVGIEDEEVELKFYGQQSDPKLEISFDSIEYLSDDYREVFENVKYLYCNGINVNNIYDLTEENSYDIAKELLDKYFDKIVELIGKPPFIFSIRIGLSNNEFSDSDLNIYYRYDYSGEKELERVKI